VRLRERKTSLSVDMRGGELHGFQDTGVLEDEGRFLQESTNRRCLRTSSSDSTHGPPDRDVAFANAKTGEACEVGMPTGITTEAFCGKNPG